MTPIVILAAGSSSRMGTPKQNLYIGRHTLLQRMVQAATAASDSVLVILGANFDALAATINDTNAGILYNKDWALGMGSSIKLAVSHIQLKHTNTDTIVFMVCDQPYVNAELLKKLIITAGKVKEEIIACSYNGIMGVPVVFKKRYFSELLTLNGKEGAKKILEQHMEDVYTVPFPLGSVDIDTEEDYNNLPAGLNL
ncbi:nucleotidyltransferase family protein [Mucilaginibacter rigui]|uniref:Nucleotidyltransferase family protein n=1 Tax=Mucilaginibacter rigui TaxID=534635 RepID=A0ABR7XAD6_9SPHI|nr:nucleotidyltransferase family protein [Mucilaginibacter rigui]MBD1387552.1 nucleotidyltransferase family protein [Mucilaginibacter rigui]